jgi:hypothetical protein
VIAPVGSPAELRQYACTEIGPCTGCPVVFRTPPAIEEPERFACGTCNAAVLNESAEAGVVWNENDNVSLAARSVPGSK